MYDGKVGTIVIVNDQRSGGSLYREYGVAFKTVRPDTTAPGGMVRQGADTTWFLPEELTVLQRSLL